MSRADSVTKYLKNKGITADRMTPVSSGDAGDALDPWGWPYDRRVTVRLKS